MSRRMRAVVAAALLGAVTAAVAARPLGAALFDRWLGGRYPDVPRIRTDALAAGAAGGPLLLDARTQDEFDVSRIPGARRFDPADAGPAGAAGLTDVDRSRPVIVYCAVGWRSADAARELLALGFIDVSNLEGGIFRWARERRPLEGPAAAAGRVHPFGMPWALLLPRRLRAPPPARRRGRVP